MRYDYWQTKREDPKNKRYEDKNGKQAVNVWVELGNKRPLVAMFIGKALKPKYYYSFNSEMDAARFIKSRTEYELNNINHKIELREKEKELKKNFKTSLKVGDILHGSWGYDMIINEFYQVTEIRNRTVILREIGVKKEAVDGCYYEHVTPLPYCFVGDPIKRIVQVYFCGGKPHEYIKLSECCDLRLCENTDKKFIEDHWD